MPWRHESNTNVDITPPIFKKRRRKPSITIGNAALWDLVENYAAMFHKTCHVSSSGAFGWLPSPLGKMATAMSNAATYFLIRKFNFEWAKKRLFHSFGIDNALIKRLANLRIEKPTAIQEKVYVSIVYSVRLRFNTCTSINQSIKDFI